MRITQGTFSFLPDLTDEQIEAQLRYALRNGWAIMVEHTDDPHPRNSLWEMWGQPLFELDEDEVEVAMREVRAAREACRYEYVKVVAYDRSLGRQTTALSFIVGRPAIEPGFRLERQEKADRQIRYTLHAYATDAPAGLRYRATGTSTVNGAPAGDDVGPRA
jgi:ribulose-bisphosphate carboxylase small chain